MKAYRVTLNEFKRGSGGLILCIDDTNTKIQTLKRDILVDDNQTIEDIVNNQYNTDSTFYVIYSVKEINIYDVNIKDLTIGEMLKLMESAIDKKIESACTRLINNQ